MQPPVRPTLKPALCHLWRDDATLQLGVHPDRALLIAGVDRQDSAVLRLLDGSRDLDGVMTAATAAGCAPERTAALIALLGAADALDDAPPGDPLFTPDLLSLSLLHRGPGAAARVTERRRASAVTVVGAGRVGAAVVGLLAAAGVGTVEVVDDRPVRPGDLSPAGIREQGAGDRATAATQPWRRRARMLRTHTPHAHGGLAVVTPAGSTPAPEVLTAVRRRPHLLATVRETTAAIGPLVLPGHSPCLRCQQLERAERDPGWPALAAQLVGSGRVDEASDVTLATLAAALTAMQALAHIDGTGPTTVGGVLEFDLADGRLRRRSVSGHPACGCGAADEGATIET